MLDKNATRRIRQIVKGYGREIASLPYVPAENQRAAIERHYRLKAYRYVAKRREELGLSAKGVVEAVKPLLDGGIG